MDGSRDSAAVFGFSNVFCVSHDTLLAASGSTLPNYR